MLKNLWSLMMMGSLVAVTACVGMDELANDEGQEVRNTSSTVTYTGQGVATDETGAHTLNKELCGIENGADADGPYLLWVLTATKATSASITGPWGTAAMTQSGNGTFKYISGWYDPDTLLGGAVSASYEGKLSNAQLVISHGCRPFDEAKPAWCSPGYWHNAEDAAWALVGHSKTEKFNVTVYDGFYGATYGTDPDLITVLTTNGGLYKGAGVLGTSPLLEGHALNAFNATGAYLTNDIPGYQYDYATSQSGRDDACPIDHHGNFKTQH